MPGNTGSCRQKYAYLALNLHIGAEQDTLLTGAQEHMVPVQLICQVARQSPIPCAPSLKNQKEKLGWVLLRGS